LFALSRIKNKSKLIKFELGILIIKGKIMNRKLSILLALFIFIEFFTKNTVKGNSPENSQPNPEWINDVGSKTMPQNNTLYPVKEFGAINDGKTLNTKYIQAAIDTCSNKGGGIVVFEEGVYLTGSLFIKEGVHLRIDKNVLILGSQNLADYPEIDTRVAGIEMKWPAALINFIGQNNVAVTGEGTVNANGKPFWDSYWKLRKEYEPKGLRWIVDYDCKRPRTMVIAQSTNVTIKGLTLQQSGFWTVHILYSQQVTVDGIIIRNNINGSGPSTDGIDIDSSSHILVKNCDIDCNDDNFCLKSGRDADGLRVNRPTEYVLITDCISRKGGGLITFGSETSGGIRCVVAQNLKAHGTGVGLRFKSAVTRGGTVEEIYLKNIEMEGVGVFFEVTMNWNPTYSYSALPEGYSNETLPYHWKVMLQKVQPAELGIPKFKNIYISDIKVTKSKRAIQAEGLKESLATNFHFTNIHIKSSKAGNIDFAQGWTFENVTIKTKDGSKLEATNSLDMRLK
jgi:polygalacturonase